MNAKFLHPAGRGRIAVGDLPERVTPEPWLTGRACCCPAWPVVQVTMPATASRPHETDLLLCAHHYRVSRPALEEAGAIVVELRGHTGDVLLPDIPNPAPALG